MNDGSPRSRTIGSIGTVLMEEFEIFVTEVLLGIS